MSTLSRLSPYSRLVEHLIPREPSRFPDKYVDRYIEETEEGVTPERPNVREAKFRVAVNPKTSRLYASWGRHVWTGVGANDLAGEIAKSAQICNTLPMRFVPGNVRVRCAGGGQFRPIGGTQPAEHFAYGLTDLPVLISYRRKELADKKFREVSAAIDAAKTNYERFDAQEHVPSAPKVRNWWENPNIRPSRQSRFLD